MLWWEKGSVPIRHLWRCLSWKNNRCSVCSMQMYMICSVLHNPCSLAWRVNPVASPQNLLHPSHSCADCWTGFLGDTVGEDVEIPALTFTGKHCWLCIFVTEQSASLQPRIAGITLPEAIPPIHDPAGVPNRPIMGTPVSAITWYTLHNGLLNFPIYFLCPSLAVFKISAVVTLTAYCQWIKILLWCVMDHLALITVL